MPWKLVKDPIEKWMIDSPMDLSFLCSGIYQPLFSRPHELPGEMHALSFSLFNFDFEGRCRARVLMGTSASLLEDLPGNNRF